MGIYYTPDGLVSQLQVKGAALFDASTSIIGSSAIADASTDTVGFYGLAGVVQPNYRETASDIATALQSIGLMSTATAT